jgi:hypothetical protein
MSRVVTPQPTHSSTGTASPSSAGPVNIPHEKIAQRAYEKWCKGGCKHGSDKQNWLDAENELRAEMARNAGSTQPRR